MKFKEILEVNAKCEALYNQLNNQEHFCEIGFCGLIYHEDGVTDTNAIGELMYMRYELLRTAHLLKHMAKTITFVLGDENEINLEV